MDAVNFCYWLQGFAEVHQLPPTTKQWDAIKEHLNLVFNKVTKPLSPPVMPWNPPTPQPIRAPIQLPQYWTTPTTPDGKPLTITC